MRMRSRCGLRTEEVLGTENVRFTHAKQGLAEAKKPRDCTRLTQNSCEDLCNLVVILGTVINCDFLLVEPN